MRLAKSEVIGMLLVRDISSHNAIVDLPLPHSDCPSLLDALAVYIDQKGKGRPKTCRVAATGYPYYIYPPNNSRYLDP